MVPDSSTEADVVWIRHRDYYVDRGETPGAPGPAPEDEEIRRGFWGWVRRTPSWWFIGFIRIWRKLISPLYGQVCSYYPSCSAYGLEAVTAHGLVRGSGLTAWRILRCNPFTGGGVDPVPASRRIWPQGQVPAIIETNHPPIPLDDVRSADDAPEQHSEADP